MGVIADVILAVAVVAVAPGAVAEFQFRMIRIRPTANGAPMAVIRLFCSLLGTERDRSGSVVMIYGFLGAALDKGEKIQNIRANKKQIIS